MHETTNPFALGMADRGRFSRAGTLRALQDGEQFVYAILTREGAVKIGVTTDLGTRVRGIRFGGTKKIMGFIPGDLTLERDVQASLEEHRIYGTLEYFYPVKPVLAKANWMRAYWGIEPLPTHYLPRLADCTFHARVMTAQARGLSVFQGPATGDYVARKSGGRNQRPWSFDPDD